MSEVFLASRSLLRPRYQLYYWLMIMSGSLTSAFRGSSLSRRFLGSLSMPFRNHDGACYQTGRIMSPPSGTLQYPAIYQRSITGYPKSQTVRHMSAKSHLSKNKKKSKKKDKAKKIDTGPSDTDLEIAQMEEDTQEWVERVVVGMNLCPFAAKPLANHQLYIVTVRGDDEDAILREILAQAQVFTAEGGGMPGTALVVCPELHPNDFYQFLDVLNMIVDGLFEDYDLTGKVQVVPFHPRFVFAGGEEDGSNDDNQQDNKMEYYTNRSPYPMFHILKEDDVSRAVEVMNGDTDRVWQRNVHFLQRLEDATDGDARSQLQSYLMKGTGESCIKDIVQESLSSTAREFPMLEKAISNDSDETSSKPPN